MRVSVLDVAAAVESILAKRRETPRDRSLLAGITGIDGSGQGYVTARIAGTLQERCSRVAAINLDGWLNLPSRRFNAEHPAGHFYDHAIRFDEMFAQLILPLKEKRSLRLVAELEEESAVAYHQHLYEFEDIDVIILEGIFLLKHGYRDHFDITFWIDCTFETALARALSREQEGLPRARPFARMRRSTSRPSVSI